MEEENDTERSESRIFGDFKTLGLVSNQVPCVLRYIHTRREHFIATCSGRSITTFAGQELKCLSVSEKTSQDIQCMAGDTYHVYTGVGQKIQAWRRGSELTHTYSGHKSNVKLLITTGEVLISVDEDGEMCVHNIKTEENISKWQVASNTFHPTAIVHPYGFVNKILLGSAEGKMQLWNFNSMKMIHQFDSLAESKINAFATGKVFSIVAVALAKKKVVVVNLEYDEVLASLDCLDEPVSLAFRDSPAYLIAGGATGSISVWDLGRANELVCYQKFAHLASVTGLVLFEGEPLMVSSSADNSVKAWIFDKPDGGFRQLNVREGHRLPPTIVRFHGEYLHVLTAGEDQCLRAFHLHNETYNRTISNYVPRSTDEASSGTPVTYFVNSSGNHQPLAEDIVTFNTDDRVANTFHFENAKKGKHIFKSVVDVDDRLEALRSGPKKPEEHNVDPSNPRITCVYLTPDNEWALVGFSVGLIRKFNMQSKLCRGTTEFGNYLRGEVTGIAVDTTGEFMASAGCIEASVLFWDFKSLNFYGSLKCQAPVQKIFSRPTSNLIGAVLSDFSILICDVSTQSSVRILNGCTQPITDAGFSYDMKWVTAATSDGCVRTWDVPTGNMIDIFRLWDGIVTSLDYSPKGEYLATTISGNLGISIWINKTMFDHVSLLPIPEAYVPENPREETNIASGVTSVANGRSTSEDGPLGASCDSKNWLFDLGGLTASSNNWMDALSLNENKKRNKPSVSLRKPDFIPFLIPSPAEGLVKQLQTPEKGTKHTPPPGLLTPFSAAIKELEFDGTGECIVNKEHCKHLVFALEKMGNSQLDLEMRALSPDSVGGDFILLRNFLNFLCMMTRGKKHYLIGQICLAMFIRIHSDEINEDPELRRILALIREDQESHRSHLGMLTTRINGLSDFLSSELF